MPDQDEGPVILIVRGAAEPAHVVEDPCDTIGGTAPYVPRDDLQEPVIAQCPAARVTRLGEAVRSKYQRFAGSPRVVR